VARNSLSALQVRFEARVDRSEEHHLWMGARDPQRGTGRSKFNGKDVTAHRLAWELFCGPVAGGAKVATCDVEPACVRVDHLKLIGGDQTADVQTKPLPARSRRGAGSIVEVRPNTFKLTVTAGAHDDGRQRRVTRTFEGTQKEATRIMAELVSDVGDGSSIPKLDDKTMIVGDLIRSYLAACSEESEENPKALAHSTLVRYEDLRKNWIVPNLGSIRVRTLNEEHIDRLFAKMRKGGLSHSHMNQTKSLLNGSLRWAKRRKLISRNPMLGFELPRSKHVAREVVPPEVAELVALLNGARERDPELAPVISLAATTGMRRGELSGLRRDRLELGEGRLRVDNAINDAGGTVVEKETKTHQARWVSLDPATVAMLRSHLTEMDERANKCGIALDLNAYVFSLEVDCLAPMRPEFLTRRMRNLRKILGLDGAPFDSTILALRKFTTTELMDAGFNPSAVSGRQGHTVQVMLSHYSKRRASADQAAAAHLGQKVFGANGSAVRPGQG
jgi:integrase